MTAPRTYTYTVAEAAWLLDVSRQRVHQLVHTYDEELGRFVLRARRDGNPINRGRLLLHIDDVMTEAARRGR